MKMFWQFIVSVAANFVFLVSGSALALYYIFITPYLPDSAIKTALNVGLPLLCFFIACYMAWRKQQLTIGELQKVIKEHDNKKPLYHLEAVEDSDAIKTLIDEVDDKIRSAKISKMSAPAPHPYLGRMGMGDPSTADWQDYIDELATYRTYLQSLIDREEYHIINFALKNKGYGDTNVSIDLRFDGFTQEVDFYNERIEQEEPQDPSLPVNAMPIGVGNRLGNQTEVQTDKPGRLVIEVDRIRHGDTVRLHHNPIFIKKTDGEKKIEYNIKSDSLTSAESGTVLL